MIDIDISSFQSGLFLGVCWCILLFLIGLSIKDVYKNGVEDRTIILEIILVFIWSLFTFLIIFINMGVFY